MVKVKEEVEEEVKVVMRKAKVMMIKGIMRKTRRNHFTPASLPLGVAEEGF